MQQKNKQTNDSQYLSPSRLIYIVLLDFNLSINRLVLVCYEKQLALRLFGNFR